MSVPAAMKHGGGGEAFMMMTKLHRQIHTKKQESQKRIKAPSLTTIFAINNNTKSTAKYGNDNKHSAPSNKLTVKIQLFQMSKMDQRRRQRYASGHAE